MEKDPKRICNLGHDRYLQRLSFDYRYLAKLVCNLCK